jgi:hypothetical protein
MLGRKVTPGGRLKPALTTSQLSGNSLLGFLPNDARHRPPKLLRMRALASSKDLNKAHADQFSGSKMARAYIAQAQGRADHYAGDMGIANHRRHHAGSLAGTPREGSPPGDGECNRTPGNAHPLRSQRDIFDDLPAHRRHKQSHRQRRCTILRFADDPDT